MDEHLKQLLLLGREHYERREYEEAWDLLTRVNEAGVRFADVFDMLGVMAHNKGNLPQARRFFERAIALNPNYTEAQLNLMVTLNDMGEYEAARGVYGSIRTHTGGGLGELDPFARGKIANMHAETSQAYQDAELRLEAIAELEKAVHLCPTFSDLRTRLGVLYRDSGDTKRARQHFEAVKELNPTFVQARILLGVLYLTLGDNAKAVEELAAVLELEPENKSAATYLKIARNQRDDARGS